MLSSNEPVENCQEHFQNKIKFIYPFVNQPEPPFNLPIYQSESSVYSAVYSGVPVFELLCKNVAVMRRRSDSYLNATQILKVAGIDKGRRTKILEREILNGEHEKVQGGYGKYQGTWIPYERGVFLAQQFGVDGVLRSILDYDLPNCGNRPPLPKKEFKKNILTDPCTSEADFATFKKQKRDSISEPNRKKKANLGSIAEFQIGSIKTLGVLGSDLDLHSHPERHRPTLMAGFLTEDPNFSPDILTTENPPFDLDVDVIIDDQGFFILIKRHTSLHWAAALAKTTIFNLLIEKNADIFSRNCYGETALIRAVLVPNNYESHTFAHFLATLFRSIPLADNKNRTIFHHIALTSGIKGHGSSCKYYLECIIDQMFKESGQPSNIIDIQDKNGDTALNIAARNGNKAISDLLLSINANAQTKNRAGLSPSDFGLDVDSLIYESRESYDTVLCPESSECEEEGLGAFFGALHDDTEFSAQGYSSVVFPTIRNESEAQINEDFDTSIEKFKNKGKQIVNAVQKMVNGLSKEYTEELSIQFNALKESHTNLIRLNNELSHTKKIIDNLRLQNSKIPEMQKKIGELERTISLNIQNVSFDMEMTDSENGDKCNKTSNEIKKLEKRIHDYQKSEIALKDKIAEIKGKHEISESKYRKIISSCAGISEDRADEIVDSLLLAADIEKDDISINDLSGFINKVKSIKK